MSDDNSDAQAEHFQSTSGSHWPRHNAPRVWFMTDGNSPIASALARQLLVHGDCVVVGTTRRVPGTSEEDRDELLALQRDAERAGDAKRRLQTIPFDIRSMSDSQAAVSTAVSYFGRLDVLLCCTGEGGLQTIQHGRNDVSLTQDSTHRLHRRSLTIRTNAKPCYESIRHKLLWSSQYYQVRPPRLPRSERWPHHPALRHHRSSWHTRLWYVLCIAMGN